MGARDRKRIADALYMLAAGADHATLLATMRRYVIVHSKTKQDVIAMLRELYMANPAVVRESIKALAQKPPKLKRQKGNAKSHSARA